MTDAGKAPIVSTNGATSGLQAHLASANQFGFTIVVDQGSTPTKLGVITVSNLYYTVVADAPQGPVLVRCTSSSAGTSFDAYVSNARIGVLAAAVISASTALGATKLGPFSTTTKVAALGKYITWRFSGGSALAGKTVEIWVATKNADGSWGSFSKLTARVADGGGSAYFWWKYSTAKWISVRAKLPASATSADSWSPARQGRWR